MKKLITTILILLFALAVFADRPTREYLVIFDNNQTAIFEADSVDEALFRFRREYKRARVFSVAQRSYVQSIWIWK